MNFLNYVNSLPQNYSTKNNGWPRSIDTFKQETIYNMYKIINVKVFPKTFSSAQNIATYQLLRGVLISSFNCQPFTLKSIFEIFKRYVDSYNITVLKDLADEDFKIAFDQIIEYLPFGSTDYNAKKKTYCINMLEEDLATFIPISKYQQPKDIEAYQLLRSLLLRIPCNQHFTLESIIEEFRKRVDREDITVLKGLTDEDIKNTIRIILDYLNICNISYNKDNTLSYVSPIPLLMVYIPESPNSSSSDDDTHRYFPKTGKSIVDTGKHSRPKPKRRNF